MLRNIINKKQGITLIALVVTIIVLLILAGVSISMLTGKNGILNRAAEAKEKTEGTQKEDEKKLQGYEDVIAQYTGNLPSRTETKPYFPNNTFSYKEGDLSTGLVIKDASQNEYVWVDVPTTIYDNATYNNNGANKPGNSEDYTNIEKCLKVYTKYYVNIDYSDKNSTFTTQYQNMLKSVYENGGFWIGRYEAGYEIDENKGEKVRDYGTDYDKEHLTTQKVVIKENAYPYNWVRRDQAQTLANGMNYEGVTSSLMFGVQWDLVLKYIEEKTVAKAEETNKSIVRVNIQNKLASNSTPIGNYYNSEFTLNRGKFAQKDALSKWYNFNCEDKTDLVIGKQKKPQSSNSNAILLTTGATEATRLQNIYDIAGNVWEWTLEICKNGNSCVSGGGSCNSNGLNGPVKNRSSFSISDSSNFIGFRVALWQ